MNQISFLCTHFVWLFPVLVLHFTCNAHCHTYVMTPWQWLIDGRDVQMISLPFIYQYLRSISTGCRWNFVFWFCICSTSKNFCIVSPIMEILQSNFTTTMWSSNFYSNIHTVYVAWQFYLTKFKPVNAFTTSWLSGMPNVPYWYVSAIVPNFWHIHRSAFENLSKHKNLHCSCLECMWAQESV